MRLKIEDSRLSTLLNSTIIGILIGLIVSIFRLSIEYLLSFFVKLYAFVTFLGLNNLY